MGTELLPAKIFWQILLRTPYPTGFMPPQKNPDDPNEIDNLAFSRFFAIVQREHYIEPDFNEVSQHLAKFKLLVHKGYRKRGTHEWKLKANDASETAANLCSRILDFFNEEGIDNDNK